MTRRVGSARLDALCAAVEIAQRPPVGNEQVGGVELAGITHVGGGDGVGLGVAHGHKGVVLQCLAGYEPQIPRGGIVVVVGQTRGVDKMGVLAAQFLGAAVHLVHESGDAAGDLLGEDVAHLVGRGHHQAVQKLLHRQHFAPLNARSGGIGRETRHGGGGGGDLLLKAQFTPFDGLQHQQRRHDLGGGSGIAACVGVLLIENGLALPVQQQHGGGLDLNILNGGGRDAQRHQRKGEGEKKSSNTVQFHNDKVSVFCYNDG